MNILQLRRNGFHIEFTTLLTIIAFISMNVVSTVVGVADKDAVVVHHDDAVC